MAMKITDHIARVFLSLLHVFIADPTSSFFFYLFEIQFPFQAQFLLTSNKPKGKDRAWKILFILFYLYFL